MLHPKLTQVVTDFDKLEDMRLQLIADDVFCCLGTTMKQAGSKEAFHKVDFLYVVKLAALAAGNFASQFMVISSLGADAKLGGVLQQSEGRNGGRRAPAPLSGHPYLPPFAAARASGSSPALGERVGAAVLGALKPLMRGPLQKIPAHHRGHSSHGHATSRRRGRRRGSRALIQ
jgi:hypothetical protein